MFVCLALLLAIAGLNSDQSLAQTDVIRLKSATRAPRGKIARVSEKTVVINESAGPRTVDVNEIDTIEYGGEPSELDRARDDYQQQRFNACIEKLDTIDTSQLDENVKAEIAFYKMAAAAKSSLAGGEFTATDAAQLAINFLNNHANNWHFYEAAGLMADLAMEAGRFDSAAEYYAKVVESGWPTFTAPAQQKLAESLINLERYDQAEQHLNAVMGTNSNDDVVQQAKESAKCLQALIVAKKGNPQSAIESLEQIIKEQDANKRELFATVYNVKGKCHLEANQTKEAIQAFLHTDLLYPTQRRQHAEALYYLAKLWKDINKTDRANRASSLLSQRYRNSHWANK